MAQTEDTINEYYLSNGDYSSNACYLKPDGSGKLGGIGKNISYEFGTYSILTDSNANITTNQNYDIDGGATSPFRNSTGTSTPIQLLYKYPQNGKFEAMKQPERTSLLKGFQHEEIYRFGIQFFDRQGNPYFTKWIGDIKMPSYGDINSNPDLIATTNVINNFRLSFSSLTNPDIQYSQVLYIKFNVDARR